MTTPTWLVFDIETCGIDDAVDYLEPVDAPANYKDPEKIAAYKQEKHAELVSRAALDCDLNRIVAIGLKRESNGPLVLLAENEAEERRVLHAFWDTWNSVLGPKVNFNALIFDLPVLLRRSQFLDVKAPHVSIDRYRTTVVDLMQFLTWRGTVKAKSLDFYCRRFGIDVPDTIDAKDIPSLAASGKGWRHIEDHCRADVEKTAALAIRLGLITVSCESLKASEDLDLTSRENAS